MGIIKKATNKYATARLIPCLACGDRYDPEKYSPARHDKCPLCGVDLSLSKEEAAKYRMGDAELSAKLSALNGKARFAGILAAVSGACMFIFFTVEYVVFGFLAVIPTLIFTIMASGASSNAKTLLAGNITKDIISRVFDECNYNAKGRLPDKLVYEANVIFNWNWVSGSDFVTAKYKGCNIQFSDIDLEEKTETTDDKGNTQTRYTERFKGQWLVMELGREVPGALRLIENAERTGKIEKMILGDRKERQSDVDTDNDEFNRRFQIRTTDPHSAFYILTPHFMEFILRADDTANTRTYLSFIDNRVHILCYTGKDSFELQKNDGANLEALRARMKSELSYITSIADELLKNRYLFGEGGN